MNIKKLGGSKMSRESSLKIVKDALVQIRDAQKEISDAIKEVEDILSTAEDAKKILDQASDLASDVEYSLGDLIDELEEEKEEV